MKEGIIKAFNEVYFSENETETKLETIQVKAEERVWMFDRYSPYTSSLSWKDAEKKFLSMLTEEQRNSISIKYDSDEYADVEEHDEERECVEMVVTFNI
jgi:hypothetical protein